MTDRRDTATLIDMLAADPRPGSRAWPAFPLLAGLPVAVLAAAFVAATGLRPGLLAAFATWPVALKFILPAAIAVIAAGLALRLTRPEGAGGLALSVLWFAALAALAAVALRLWQMPAPARLPALTGQTLAWCLSTIPALGLPGLAVGLSLLRRGASTRPALSGAAAGLAAGGLSALLYALHCPEDEPVFFLTWYGTGIVILAAAGAVAGPRVLRW